MPKSASDLSVASLWLTGSSKGSEGTYEECEMRSVASMGSVSFKTHWDAASASSKSGQARPLSIFHVNTILMASSFSSEPLTQKSRQQGPRLSWQSLWLIVASSDSEGIYEVL